jgi:hypothetical protein
VDRLRAELFRRLEAMRAGAGADPSS